MIINYEINTLELNNRFLLYGTPGHMSLNATAFMDLEVPGECALDSD